MTHDTWMFLTNTGICVFFGGLYLWFRWWLYKRDTRLQYGNRTVFTWWTYYIAHRRAFNREYAAFADHHSSFRGPDQWQKAMHLTALIHARKVRERTTKCSCGHSQDDHITKPDGLWRIVFEGPCTWSKQYYPGILVECGCEKHRLSLVKKVFRY